MNQPPKYNISQLLQLMPTIAILTIAIGLFAQLGFTGKMMLSIFDIAHVYAIVFFFVGFLFYQLRDRLSIVWLPIVATIYYATHEGLFNVFFFGYNRSLPPLIPIAYIDLAVQVLVSGFFLMFIALRPKSLLRKHRRMAIAAWIILVAFDIAWFAVGFPVTASVFTGYHPIAIASYFEIGWNALFTLAFFVTFSFRRPPKAAKYNELGKAVT